ncbi:MAG: ROK family transcriptional regulator [Sumerlaeia bacterium]
MSSPSGTGSAMLMRSRDSRRAQVLYQLWKEGPISRGALADLMNLNLPTVSAVVQDLVKSGEVIEEGFATSTGGRKAQLLDVNPKAGGIVAVEFSSRGIMCASSDMKGRLQNHVPRPFDPRMGVDAAIEAIIESIEDQRLFLRDDESLEMSHIGLVISGLIDERAGISKSFPRFDEWKDVPIVEILQNRFKVPVHLSGHVIGTSLAETIFGKFKDTQNFIYVHLGPGLAIGIVVDGAVYRGAKATVGEFGHMTVMDEGPICYCGNYGCLETMASDWALVAQAEEAIERGGVMSHIPDYIDDSGKITPAAIFHAAEVGDRLAENLIEKGGHYIGTALAGVVNLLAPQVILIGGSMAEEGAQLIQAIQHTIKRRALEALETELPVVQDTFGQQAGVFGAVAIALHNHYSSFED